MELSVIVLAAGKGKRMASGISKVLHSVGGIPLLERVLNTVGLLKAYAIYVVVHSSGEESLVHEKFNHLPIHWVEQNEQLGTGHAVSKVIPLCSDDNDRILVLYGDVPLVSAKTLRDLLHSTPSNGLGLVAAELPDPTGWGRIIRNEFSDIVGIVEHNDADKQQLKIREINTGIMTTSSKNLKRWLPKLGNNNRQKEYYLTDIVAMAVSEGCPIYSIMAHCFEEVQGVNNRWDLAKLERYFQRSMAKKLALSGATIIDPNRIDIRGDNVHVSHDVVIDVNVILEGKIRLGRNARIGPNVLLRNVTIGKNTEILSNSVIEDAIIGAQCSVGPFARIRPGSILEEGAKVGNFVEIKKSTLGIGSKANHLTYLGDATVGKNVNIGAGTITCNYDGTNKWPIRIEDGAFVGSHAALIAPVIIGKNATIGAGSTITQNAPANHLTLARKRQHTIKNWSRSKKGKTNDGNR